MFDRLYDPEFLIVFILLMIVIWISHQYVRLSAYSKGATQGFAFGIERTIETLINEDLINEKNATRTFKKDELIKLVTPIITAGLVKELERKV